MDTKLSETLEAKNGTRETIYPSRQGQDRHLGLGLPLWALAFGTLLLASAAILLVVWDPRALALALGAGVLALGTRAMFGRVRSVASGPAVGSSTVANAGLVVAGMAVAPLLAFAVLWLTLLVLIGATWVLHLLRLI